jgi:polysaccharide export outer membrane protein
MRRLVLGISWTVLVLVLAGCQTIDFYDQSLEEPCPPHMVPPREKEMMSLPVYRIEPPDVLQIQLLKQVPLPPYRLETYDVLQINVIGTLLDQPIAGFYLIEGEGQVNLGVAYGSVRVLGMTVEEAQEAIFQHLKQILAMPEVSVQLARTSGMLPVSGTYLVGPDGTVNLRQYGTVHLAGQTLVEGKRTLEKHLSQFFDSPEVVVEVGSFNSKFYYIITEGAGQGDNIVKVPITGNETVLDAIAQLRGLSSLSSTNIWIARPAPGGFGCVQHLPVDYVAITRDASTATNYQIFPGDRVFIAEDPTIALTNYLGKVAGPLERVVSIGGLFASTIRNWQSLGRGYNQNRPFF